MSLSLDTINNLNTCLKFCIVTIFFFYHILNSNYLFVLYVHIFVQLHLNSINLTLFFMNMLSLCLGRPPFRDELLCDSRNNLPVSSNFPMTCKKILDYSFVWSFIKQIFNILNTMLSRTGIRDFPKIWKLPTRLVLHYFEYLN